VLYHAGRHRLPREQRSRDGLERLNADESAYRFLGQLFYARLGQLFELTSRRAALSP
jgi:hypothetical protein